MHLHALSLADFRNYEKLDFRPSEGLNVLLGPNAQGKSGILEAIYVLATSKSHRTSHDADMIRIGQQMAKVHGDIKRTARNDVSLEIILSRSDSKTVKINTVRHPRIGDIVGQLNAVIFSSSDLDMVKGEPSRRRRFLNLEISQVSPQYVYSLGRCKRVLEQRNNLLKDIRSGTAKSTGLAVWDRQLAEYAASVITRRERFIGLLRESAVRIYSLLTQQSERLEIAYRPSPEEALGRGEQEIGEMLTSLMASRTDADIARGSTLIGPHRDEVLLTVNGMPLREYGSQGQQRTAALSLKLAEVDLIERAVGEAPVALLDDVMGELDETRRRQVLSLVLGRCQTLVTTTHISEIAPEIRDQASVFELASGRVTPR